ncbi:DUF3267 domain-containing protein [Pengzhenrongella phosphoraccumulans]|uniref:DUF3267 domain-containing protein n=1 Tax=Pengzhenrongella phosphoraccumulans TaxID=3114394 RepID=UPI00388E0F40
MVGAFSIAVTLVACVLYMWAHEATHGLLLTALSGQRSHYALRLPYLTTGNDAFVGRGAFFVVALGPLVLWGVVLLGLFMMVPADAHLTVYILGVLNLAGSGGDLFRLGGRRGFPGRPGCATTATRPLSWSPGRAALHDDAPPPGRRATRVHMGPGWSAIAGSRAAEAEAEAEAEFEQTRGTAIADMPATDTDAAHPHGGNLSAP